MGPVFRQLPTPIPSHIFSSDKTKLSYVPNALGCFMSHHVPLIKCSFLFLTGVALCHARFFFFLCILCWSAYCDWLWLTTKLPSKVQNYFLCVVSHQEPSKKQKLLKNNLQTLKQCPAVLSTLHIYREFLPCTYLGYTVYTLHSSPYFFLHPFLPSSLL